MSEIFKYGVVYFKIQDPENSLQIKPYQAELENSRAEDLKSVINSVSEVRRDLEILRCEVCNHTNNQSMDYIRKHMYRTAGNISRLKEIIKEELLTLLKKEANLDNDIQFMQRRIGELAKSIDVRVFKPIKQSKYQSIKTYDDNPAKEFQKFLSCFGGHYGGWQEHDHLLFLRERTKHKGKDKFLLAVQNLLPELSSEEIENHEKWYRNYESLKNSQKDLIQKWKSEKESQKLEKKDKEMEESKKKENRGKRLSSQQIDITERIKEWKNQQKLQKLKEEEEQKKEKEKLKEKERRKKELQEIKKLAIKQYKAEKHNKTQVIFPVNDSLTQAQEAKAKNKILLEAFRLQDLKFIEKKKIIRLQMESKSHEKLKRLKLEKPVLEYIFQRNPQRVFQPTFNWNQHCLKADNKEKSVPAFDLNSIPRLAVPEWRRELK